jgi:hypothetical protein
MKAMTTKARVLGIKPNWYNNNCYCHDMFCDGAERCFEGNVKTALDFGFEGIKCEPSNSIAIEVVVKW